MAESLSTSRHQVTTWSNIDLLSADNVHFVQALTYICIDVFQALPLGSVCLMSGAWYVISVTTWGRKEDFANTMISWHVNSFRITDTLWGDPLVIQLITLTKGQWCGALVLPLMSSSTIGQAIYRWFETPRRPCHFNTLRPRQDGRHFPDGIFKCIFLNENVLISIKISLKFVPNGQINNIPALV